YIFFFQAEDGIRDYKVTGVQTCALPICRRLIRGGCGGESGQGGRDERRKQAHGHSLTAAGGPEFLHRYRRLQAAAWLRARTAYTYRMSDAKSASRERSPRTSVTCPECAQPRKRLTA